MSVIWVWVSVGMLCGCKSLALFLSLCIAKLYMHRLAKQKYNYLLEVCFPIQKVSPRCLDSQYIYTISLRA